MLRVTPPGSPLTVPTVVWAAACLAVASNLATFSDARQWGWGSGAVLLGVWGLKVAAAAAGLLTPPEAGPPARRPQWRTVPVLVLVTLGLVTLDVPLRVRFAVSYGALHATAGRALADPQPPRRHQPVGAFWAESVVAGGDVVRVYAVGWTQGLSATSYNGFVYVGPHARPADVPAADGRLAMGGGWYAFR